MKRIAIILVSLLFFLCCKADQGSDKIKLLQGAWFQVGEENAAFLIKERSLLFFEDTTKYTIKVKGRSLEVYQEKDLFTTYEIIKLDNHNLWLKAIEGNTLKLIKKK